MATIIIPTPLRKYTNQKRSFATDKQNLKEALQQLMEEYPDVRKNLLNEKGEVRSYIKIYIGDDEVNPAENGSYSLQEDTEVSIVPAIAGGVCGCAEGIAHGAERLSIVEVTLSR